jgi:hypothetical protein
MALLFFQKFQITSTRNSALASTTSSTKGKNVSEKSDEAPVPDHAVHFHMCFQASTPLDGISQITYAPSKHAHKAGSFSKCSRPFCADSVREVQS